MKNLEEAKPFSVLATGVVTEPMLDAYPVRWVAVRGGVADWCIYYHREDSSIQFVRESGEKVTTANIIENLVPCTKEVLKQYRL
jgi:hypothetical protein